MPRSYHRRRIARAFGLAAAMTVVVCAGSASAMVFAIALLSR